MASGASIGRATITRLAMSEHPLLHVVLVAPEIPQNTGSIARLCAATYCRLHLVRPLGFSLEDRYLKRAGLDYWPYVDLQVHDHWEGCATQLGGDSRQFYFFSARAERTYWSARYRPGDVLVFGSETRGLPEELRRQYADRLYVIPIDHPRVRSLNLSNAVAIVVYEALRQMRA
ncbi:MAG: putative tRNA (cytidine(34)-2'-O)-methyltransferase [Candidatus Binatia bacterium]|nr:MAG: putative tRNA (cytidine(34)-2'-O)-methyltransferase [Candidatus Binatia bacterium]